MEGAGLTGLAGGGGKCRDLEWRRWLFGLIRQEPGRGQGNRGPVRDRRRLGALQGLVPRLDVGILGGPRRGDDIIVATPGFRRAPILGLHGQVWDASMPGSLRSATCGRAVCTDRGLELRDGTGVTPARAADEMDASLRLVVGVDGRPREEKAETLAAKRSGGDVVGLGRPMTGRAKGSTQRSNERTEWSIRSRSRSPANPRPPFPRETVYLPPVLPSSSRTRTTPRPLFCSVTALEAPGPLLLGKQAGVHLSECCERGPRPANRPPEHVPGPKRRTFGFVAVASATPVKFDRKDDEAAVLPARPRRRRLRHMTNIGMEAVSPLLRRERYERPSPGRLQGQAR